MAGSGPGFLKHTISTRLRSGEWVYCIECGDVRPPGQHAHSRRQVRAAPRPSTVTHNSTTNSEPPWSGRARHSQPPVELDAQEQENRDVDPPELPASPVPTTHQGANYESSHSITREDGPVASDEDIGRLDGTQRDRRSPNPSPVAGSMQPTPAGPAQPPGSVNTQAQQTPQSGAHYVLENDRQLLLIRQQRPSRFRQQWPVQDNKVGIWTWNQPS